MSSVGGSTGEAQEAGEAEEEDGDDEEALEQAFLDPVTLALLERPVTLSCGHNVSKAVLRDMRRMGLKR